MKKTIIKIVHLISVFITIYCLIYLNGNASSFSIDNIMLPTKTNTYSIAPQFYPIFNENLSKIYRYVELKNFCETNGYLDYSKNAVSGYKNNRLISFTIGEMLDIAKEVGYSINGKNEVVLNEAIFRDISSSQIYLDSAKKDFFLYPFDKNTEFKPFAEDPLISIIDAAYDTMRKIAEYRSVTSELNSADYGIDFIIHYYSDNRIVKYQNHSNVSSNNILRNPYHIIVSNRQVENNISIDGIDEVSIQNRVSLLNPYSVDYYIFELGFNNKTNLATTFIAKPVEGVSQEETNNNYYFMLSLAIFCSILSLITFVLLIFTTGVVKYAGTQTIHLNFYDNIFFELQLILAAIVIIANTLVKTYVSVDSIPLFSVINDRETIFLPIYLYINYLVFLIVLLSLVRKIKSKNLSTNSILYDYFNNLRGMNTSLHTINAGIYSIIYYVFIIASIVICMFLIYGYVTTRTLLFIILAICLGGTLFLSIIYFNMIIKIINANISSDNSMKQIQDDFLTNISPDIKTPLTSIINYSDILLRENGLNETDMHYLNIIHSKSLRLKAIVNDLMEINRIESNSLQLKMKKINFAEIVKQAFGEYADQFETKGLEIIYSINNSDINIVADGNYLWRILDNLCSNILKYAREKTRILIYMIEDGIYVKLMIKNLSDLKLEPNVDWTSRFVTADVSRTNGSYGLGLNIATKLAKLQKGALTIRTDEDYFISELSFRIAR